MKSVRDKALGLVSDINKKHGEGSAMIAADIPLFPPISSGSLALDFAVGFGGMPSDRVMEIFGREGTGKTTLALLIMEQFLNAQPDRLAVILDTEHKMSKGWLEQILPPGWLDSRVIYLQPNHIEQATNMYAQAVESGLVCFALLDSIGGSPTVRSNEDAEVGRVGGNSIGVGEFGRRAANLSAKFRCLTVGVNQVRANMNPRAFADETPGGRAWRHACILRIELVRGRDHQEAVVNGEKIRVGHTVAAKVRKNHLAPEGRTAFWWFYNVPTEDYGFGVDTLDEIARLGVLTQVVKLKGSWYHHPALPEYKDSGDHKVQGLPALKQLVRGDEALRKTLASEILASIGDYSEQVAPISDPDAPVQVNSFLLTGEAS